MEKFFIFAKVSLQGKFYDTESNRDRVRWPVFQNLKNEQKFDSANQIPEPVRLVPWL